MNLKQTKLQGQGQFRDSMPERVSVTAIFWTFFRVGLFTLGGGLAMLPVMRHEIVLKQKWLDNSDFHSMVSLATAIPGAIAVNTAYLLGRRLGGKQGLAAAVLGTILPSYIVILLVVWILSPFFKYPKVAAFLRGCSIAVAGQLAFAGLIFGRRSLGKWQHIIGFIIGLTLIGILKIHPIWGIISVSIFGFFFFPYK
ncbi:MAG TPA: chromate transporter [Atribacterota bacterium]|nr:chromate transporter [Atribacterota bacterium]